MRFVGSRWQNGFWAVFILLVSLTSVQGQQVDGQAAGSSAPRPPQSGDIHPQASSVYIHVGKTGLGHEHAVIGKLKYGQLQLNRPGGTGVLVFDMTSFKADTDEARKYLGFEGTSDASTQEQVNANMLGSSVLDVKHYPTAVFKVSSIEPMPQRDQEGNAQFALKGDFTLHGTTKPIQVVAAVRPQGEWLHLRGRFDFLQTDYGMTPFSKGFGVIGVADKLTIHADFWIIP